MTKGWTSTLQMMNPDDGPPITSPHRRMREWRDSHMTVWQHKGSYYPYVGYLFNGKEYTEETRKVKRGTVWCIDRRLVLVR
jgi:hypothetical protein